MFTESAPIILTFVHSSWGTITEHVPEFIVYFTSGHSLSKYGVRAQALEAMGFTEGLISLEQVSND
jgi:hypothetical protein